MPDSNGASLCAQRLRQIQPPRLERRVQADDEHRIVAGAGHNIHLDRADAVIAAIRELLETSAVHEIDVVPATVDS